jgi:hypothetical protein
MKDEIYEEMGFISPSLLKKSVRSLAKRNLNKSAY